MRSWLHYRWPFYLAPLMVLCALIESGSGTLTAAVLMLAASFYFLIFGLATGGAAHLPPMPDDRRLFKMRWPFYLSGLFGLFTFFSGMEFDMTAPARRLDIETTVHGLVLLGIAVFLLAWGVATNRSPASE
jgi:hypothetical protein